MVLAQTVLQLRLFENMELPPFFRPPQELGEHLGAQTSFGALFATSEHNPEISCESEV